MRWYAAFASLSPRKPGGLCCAVRAMGRSSGPGVGTAASQKNGPHEAGQDARERIRSNLPPTVRMRAVRRFGEALVWRAVQAARFCFIDGYTIGFNAAGRRLAANPTSPRPTSIMA